MEQKPWTVGNSVIGYDPVKRRVWIAGQRVHHGLTGVALTAAGIAGLAAGGARSVRSLRWAVFGTALIAHDWKDRSIWFERGPGSQL